MEGEADLPLNQTIKDINLMGDSKETDNLGSKKDRDNS